MSPTKELESITSLVLFVSSHITRNSSIPPSPWIVLKSGSTVFLNCDRVNSLLFSNSNCREALEIVFFRRINKRRTLIRSNAPGRGAPVLSPNKSVPSPGKVTTGFTPALYSASRSAFVGSDDPARRALLVCCPPPSASGWRLRPSGQSPCRAGTDP